MPKTEKTVSSDDNSFYQSMHKYTISPFASFCVDAWNCLLYTSDAADE